MSKTRKQIIFDLDTKELERYYPTENWRNAYNDIKKVMIASDFKWIEGSGYISNNQISIKKTQKILKDMTNKYPYLNKCMRDCSISSITSTHSQNHLFDKEINLKPLREVRRSLTDMLLSAKKKADEHNKSLEKVSQAQSFER